MVFQSGDIHEQLKELPNLERRQLQTLWLELFGKPPNSKLRRELLVPVLAYRLQEKRFGGLKPATVRKLRKMADEFNRTGKIGSDTTNAIRPGTRFVREWRGRMHEVLAQDSGFEYKGSKYGSLSEIAREITGTRWSGPAFFAVRKEKGRPR